MACPVLDGRALDTRGLRAGLSTLLVSRPEAGRSTRFSAAGRELRAARLGLSLSPFSRPGASGRSKRFAVDERVLRAGFSVLSGLVDSRPVFAGRSDRFSLGDFSS